MGAEDGGHASIQMPAQRHLLARHLGVEVDDHHVGLAVESLQDRVDLGERRARHPELHRAAQVDDRDPLAGDLDNCVSASRVAVRVVGRAHDAVGAIQVPVGLAVSVDVIAGRDHVGAGGEQLLRRPLGDSQPAG